MTELRFDRPVPELTAEKDAATLVAIEQGLAQLDAGQGISLEEIRAELTKRCLTRS
jgi:hypothetical protein